VAHRGPVITALVVVGGLVGLMTVNSVGGLVVAGEAPKDKQVAATEDATPPGSEPAAEPPAPPSSSEKPPPPKEAPPAPTFPAEAVYAGNAKASPLAIAVAVKGDEAAAYLCDGVNVEKWLKGTATEGKVNLTSADKSSKLVAGLKGRQLAGDVMVNGQKVAFSITVAKKPAGVYRGEGGDTTIGWIVMANGTQVGVSTTEGRSVPAPELDPASGAVTVDGQRVVAEKVNGDTTFG